MIMASFITDDFLLENKFARTLYHEYASKMPVVDYHNHLSPADIASDRTFSNITEAWLDGDHYKWRAMRTNGVSETYCTGNAEPREKFLKWAETVPYTIRNPLYHWTHLELKRYFGIDELLSPSNASTIYDQCSARLQERDMSVQALLRRMHVEVICTTDDPVDSLEHHARFASAPTDFRMLPTFRPDKAWTIAHVESYLNYIDKLSHVSAIRIGSFDDLIQALQQRMAFFESHGCRVADHGISVLWYDQHALEKAPAIFNKLLKGHLPDADEIRVLQCAIMLHLCRSYAERGWVQQFHIGAQRNNNSRLMRMLGPDTGFDSIGDEPQAAMLARFLGHLDNDGHLARTILYNLNPADNAVFATMIGNFNDGSVAAKIQYGSGWWFLDQKDGMEAQMNSLSNMGLIAKFVGMVTDSRSFLSFPRHEYFRRVLCNLFGRDVYHGHLPEDLNFLGSIIQDICYNNTRTYFRF